MRDFGNDRELYLKLAAELKDAKPEKKGKKNHSKESHNHNNASLESRHNNTDYKLSSHNQQGGDVIKKYYTPTKYVSFRNIMGSTTSKSPSRPSQKQPEKKYRLPDHFKILLRRDPPNGNSDKSIKVATMKRIVVDKLGVDFNAQNMARMKTPEQRKMEQEQKQRIVQMKI